MQPRDLRHARLVIKELFSWQLLNKKPTQVRPLPDVEKRWNDPIALGVSALLWSLQHPSPNTHSCSQWARQGFNCPAESESMCVSFVSPRRICVLDQRTLQSPGWKVKGQQGACHLGGERTLAQSFCLFAKSSRGYCSVALHSDTTPGCLWRGWVPGVSVVLVVGISLPIYWCLCSWQIKTAFTDFDLFGIWELTSWPYHDQIEAVLHV